MPHPLFEIDELIRPIIDDLVEISPRTAVSLALTCRSLEEPTLSSLWKRQPSLDVLLMVLPGCTLPKPMHGLDGVAIEYDPPPEEWARLQRYSSWMRVLYLDLDRIAISDTLPRLSSNLPGGVLLPKLERLRWDVVRVHSHLPFFRLFLSPHLKHVHFYTVSSLSTLPLIWSTPLVRMISSLPTSLEDLTFMCDKRREGSLKDAISSLVCRCGPSLRRVLTSMPISEAALLHLMQLPNLSSWRAVQGPPQIVPTLIFPSLREFYVGDQEALPWLQLLSPRQNGTPQNGSTSAITDASTRKTPKSLDFPANMVVGSTWLSSVVKFRNLVTLHVRTRCLYSAESCTFHFTDDDMENLASALPRLSSLRLGMPCRGESCNTTVASLMSVSVHCLDLEVLETHFSTQTIVGDIRRLLDEDTRRDKTKCKLQELLVGSLPLEVREEDIETIAMGFESVFPHLKNIVGDDDHWKQVKPRLGIDGEAVDTVAAMPFL